MAVFTVKIDRNGGVPEAEITFGNAQLGNYECDLVKAPGASVELKEGDSVDDVPDSFSVQDSPKQLLDGKEYLRWTVIVQKLDQNLDRNANVTIQIKQDGKPLDPPIRIQDEFPSGSASLVKLIFVRFE